MSLPVNNILELVGGTPMVRINRLNHNPGVTVYAKLEFMNPGGSVKDRPALNMIEEAERRGELSKDKVLLEATSGNTGIGLAMACAVKGYKMLFTMAESASMERRKILKAYGADILLTPAHLSTDGAIEEAYRLAREEPDRYFLVDQFNNEDNWRAHAQEGATADEIYADTEGKVDLVVATLGTSGTVMGLSRRFHQIDPSVKVVAVEPYQGHKIQGLKNMKESYPPGIFQPAEVDILVNVDDDSAYEMSRRLAREEGIFVGMSAGAAMKVALDQAATLPDGSVVVALMPDGGERYLSTPLFTSEKVAIPLRFYNTLSRQVEDLVPTQPGRVGIYACGPSLDGPPDLGLGRRMIFADLARRYLEFRGFEVKLVINIADVDDRTINQCLAEGADWKQFTAKWEQAFFQDMAALGMLPALDYPKASEHVSEIVETARDLLDKGLAYEKLRSIYFNISRFENYGKLSGVDIAATQCDKHTDYDYYEKENPRDFTIFKRASLADLKAGIYWQTPWGNVRPGWHVECATMSSKHLGQPFDIHLASTDLIFPHGENEIAVAEGLTGKPLANLWMHSEVVVVDGKKASRVAGNDVTIREVLEQGYSPATVRLWLLGQHYRRPLTYDHEQLDQAAKSVERFNDFVARLSFMSPCSHAPDLDQYLYEVRSGIQQSMDNDLNVPKAMGHLFAFIRRINRLMNSQQMDASQVEKVLGFMEEANQVLGIIDLERPSRDPEIDELLTRRQAARDAGDYALADQLRDELAERGIQVADTPTGTRWCKM
ncbi:MAG: cysteine--tRNA ligase [Desulfarculaceae bacterium]|nr:cysteine--tRNA ligase [Desulfarculaceae bacterium]MCF8073607.1 cysteine--tRNA ligase [Desulfarculaceae bacterium]MCF8103161.1 cysteine--tRNA ligase [Desulfarculaceae bacterium]MCF8115677.1 cysteine--tRNA ligase [Desulfarculaceae bacterium]